MNQLFDKILTKEDVIYLKEKILKLQQLVFKKSGLLSEKAEGLVESELLETILEAEKEGKIFFDPKKQFEFLEVLQRKLEALPVFKITIAFSPSPQIIRRIIQFLRKETKEKVILDINVDPEIVGGAIFEYKGKYLDFSLTKEVKKFLKTKWQTSKKI